MSKIKLNESQLERKKYILKCLSQEMTTLEASINLNITQRAVQQNICRFNKIGDKAFIHGNTGKKKETEYFIKRKQKVLDIFLNTRIDGINPFENISYAYFTELLNEDYKIKCSESWVKKVLKSIGYKSPNKYKSKKETL